MIAFVGDYLREYDHLPLGAEVATGCGFGSPRAADRLLRELEGQGVIRRDGRYQRLGTINLSPAAPLVDPTTQLFLAELAIVEITSLLATLRCALDLTTDSSHSASLYLEGVRRSVLLQAFEATRKYLLDAGVNPSHRDTAALCEARSILGELRDLAAEWDSFCVSRLVWNLSILEWARGIEPLDLGYVGSNVVAARRTLTQLLPTYQREASSPLSSGSVWLTDLMGQISSLLARFRQAMACRFDFEPSQLSINARDLLARAAA